MRSRIAAGIPVDLPGYHDEKVIAWCSIAPRATCRGLGGPDNGGENVWSLACFFVNREHPGKGFTAQLIAVSVTHARDNGATMLQACPVDPDSPGFRFMGFVPVFAKAGFTETGRRGNSGM